MARHVPRSYYDPVKRVGLILHTPLPHIILKLNCAIREETEFRIYLSNMLRMAYQLLRTLDFYMVVCKQCATAHITGYEMMISND